MTAFKRTFVLGQQAIPPFANYATLMQTFIRDADFPGGHPGSPFNIACLGFQNRGSGRETMSNHKPQSFSFWSDTWSPASPLVFGRHLIPVPPWAEYFSVAWLKPPDDTWNDNIDIEDVFYIRWKLIT